jgi:hypothetical protein
LPFLTVFFAILFLLFYQQELGVALRRNGCNHKAKKIEVQNFPLLCQNKELVPPTTRRQLHPSGLNMFENSAGR